jgi:acetyl esterase/lipase
MSAPGRLGDPSRSLATDPRTDPPIAEVLGEFYLAANTPAPPVSRVSSRPEKLAFCAGAEESLDAMFAVLSARVPQTEGVVRETVKLAARGGHEVALYVHRPRTMRGPVPCVVHLHGGGMVILEAANPAYAHWRDRLAAEGLVVVGVEFRNGGGKLGDHRFPAGLEDCVDAVQWAVNERAHLGASGVVVSGDSGGGNLTLATAIVAGRDGWADQIAGFYAQCPYISGAWHDPPTELPSMRENDGYFVSCALFEVFRSVYDPDDAHAEDPTCWPLRASTDDLLGLPPHAVSVNELDLLRDEGIAYYRKLRAAGVSTVGRTVLGTPHGADVLLPGAIPDVTAASARDVAGFARRVTGGLRCP